MISGFRPPSCNSILDKLAIKLKILDKIVTREVAASYLSLHSFSMYMYLFTSVQYIYVGIKYQPNRFTFSHKSYEDYSVYSLPALDDWFLLYYVTFANGLDPNED